MTKDLEYVSGWGGNPKARTRLVIGSTVADLRQVLLAEHEGSRGVIARGLGRSYGDAAQRSGGTTLEIVRSGEPEWVDRSAGVVRSPAGVSIGELIRFADAEGFFVPVTPGTRYVTIGGAIAADIHGKDHHSVGSFGKHVVSFRLLMANGDIVDVDPTSDLELFNATIGGMGLTGIILDADLRLSPVSGNRLDVDLFRTNDLQATMDALTGAETSHRYSVAWVDMAGGGSAMGRGVVTNGNHTDVRDSGQTLREPILGVPPIWRIGLVNKLSVMAFNEVWFRKAPAKPKQVAQSYDSFFYPLDVVRDWNRVYGRGGFLQYQFVLPFRSETLLPRLMGSLATGPSPVALAVLKRFGPESDGYLSFPLAGWTLAADIPIPRAPSHLEARLRSIDEILVSAGGRVYLAKDSRLGADLLPEMYPKLIHFTEVRDRVDPGRLFQSDLAARLRL